jgi:hypothetical protein
LDGADDHLPDEKKGKGTKHKVSAQLPDVEELPPPSPTMSNSLDDLKKHIPDQTLKIDQIINSSDHFSDSGPDVSAWATVRDSLWGKGLASLDDPLSNTTRHVVKIPEIMPDLWGLNNSRILVRSEYEEAEQAALSASAKYVEAFLLTGQPGTGPPPLILLLRRT